MGGNAKGISVRVQPLTASKAAGQARHDLRLHAPSYVDASKSHLNRAGKSVDIKALADEVASHRAAAGQQKLRKDAQLVVAGIITFGTEAQKTFASLSAQEQDKVFAQVAKRIAAETGRELLSASVHRDEASPHAHFMLRAHRYDEATGREEPWRLSKAEMSHLQDVAAEEVKSLGIERGFKKSQRLQMGDSPADLIHKSVREMHDAIPADLDKARKTLADATEKAQEAQRRLEATQAKLAKATSEDAVLSKRLATYEKRVESAQKALEKAELEMSQLTDLVEVPALKTVQVLQKDTRSFLQKLTAQPIPTKTVKVFPADAADAVKRSEALRGEAVRKERETTEKLERWRHEIERVKVRFQDVSTEADRPGSWLKMMQAARFEERYGVVLAVAEGKASAPPQKASAKQIAAALYTHAKDQKKAGVGRWETAVFRCEDAVASEIMKMAKDDKTLDVISFVDPEQAKTLDKALALEHHKEHEHEREDDGPELEIGM